MAGRPDSGSGASLFWTSADPDVARARQLAGKGRFAEAEKLLGAAPPAGEPDADRARAEGIEILRRIRRDYSLDAESLLERLRPTLPDVSAADLERWRATGQVQHRLIDGRVCYFRREPANLWRFCEEARRARDAKDGAPGARRTQAWQALRTHLKEALAAADRTGTPEVLPVRHKVRYRLTVKPDRLKAGQRVRCWLPFPQQWNRQRDVKLIATRPEAHQVAPTATEGDPPRGALQRTVYFEQRVDCASEPIAFEAEYSFVNSAFCPALADDRAQPSSTGCCRRWLAERRPHIVFTDELKRTVDALTVGVPNPLARARKIFEWVAANIRYCAEQEYATIPCLTRWGLKRRRGDCGLQAMLFIAMCRYADVPARWQSGWVTFTGLIDMHDWAEFYVAPWGWLPADVSYGPMASDDPRVRMFYFGSIDAYRMIVNVDYGAPLDPPTESLRSEPADFQRGEVEVDGRNLYFDEWDYAFTSSVEAIE